MPAPQMKNFPIRIYVPSKPPKLLLVPPLTPESTRTKLSDVLKLIDFQQDFKVVAQGIQIDLEWDLWDVYMLLSFADHFLHLTLIEINPLSNC